MATISAITTDLTHDELLRETVARHFPEARVEAQAIELGFGELEMSCWVESLRDVGPYKSASLFFLLRGGNLGDAAVFASVSGYAETPEAAIVTGACNWTCAFGPVLRAGLGGANVPDVDHFDVSVDGQAFRVFVDSLDRAMLFKPGDSTERIAAARARFCPGSWLVREVLASGRLPLLHADRPSIVSVFVSDGVTSRTVEVKVNGWDWPGIAPLFASVAPEPEGGVALLRELAVIVPIGPAPALAHAPIARTLEGLSSPKPRRDATTWLGWKHHGGLLGPPLSPAQLASVEACTGPLPADYRTFVTDIAALGAGPGYGLLSPTGSLAARMAAGTFTWQHDSKPTTPAAGAIPIAHAGCGVMWLLVLSGRHTGEVWLDARSSDRKVRRVAPTFSAWYRDWLAAAVQNAQPWLQWDAGCCATPSVLSQVIESLRRNGIPDEAMHDELPKRLKPGSVSLASTGSSYFAPEAALDACQGCISLAARFGLGSDVFLPADEPELGRSDELKPRDRPARC
jgi:hypothetical protein